MRYQHRRHAGRDRIVDAEIMKLELRDMRLRAAPRPATGEPSPLRRPAPNRERDKAA